MGGRILSLRPKGLKPQADRPEKPSRTNDTNSSHHRSAAGSPSLDPFIPLAHDSPRFSLRHSGIRPLITELLLSATRPSKVSAELSEERVDEGIWVYRGKVGAFGQRPIQVREVLGLRNDGTRRSDHNEFDLP